MFPKQAVGSVVGLGGMAGAVGAMLILKLTGYVLGDKPDAHAFAPLFIIAASAYVISIVVLHLAVPRLEPARIEV
jgi:ACS family hexuronate transporter-like MFS transporter